MTMAVHVRAPRRRADLVRDDRLQSVDMRTRTGKRFAAILAAVRSEFGDADPIRLGEVVRLRMISENAQRDCLAGSVPLDRLVRVQNLLIRAERQLTAVGRGKPSHAGQDLAAYLAELVEDAEAEVEPVEVESGMHAAPDLDIPAAEGVEP